VITLIFKKIVILCILFFGIWGAMLSLIPAFAKADNNPFTPANLFALNVEPDQDRYNLYQYELKLNTATSQLILRV
jgi:hypothetical protein